MTNATLVDTAGNAPVYTPSALGFLLPVTPPYDAILTDNFNGTTIDIVNRWQAPVIAGSATMTQAAGNLVATLGTTASNAAAITSMESFEPSFGNITLGTLVSIEASPGINTNRCIGFYTRPGSFTAATPVQDGYVWEYDITGSFGVSIYNNGTRIYRTVVALNGATFLPIGVAYQGLNVAFYYQNLQVPILTVPLLQPSTLNLPVGFHAINHTAGPVGAPTWSCASLAGLDQSGAVTTVFNGQTISRTRSPGKFIALNNVSVAAEATIWTPASGRKFRLMGYCLTALGAAGNVVLKDNTAGTSLPMVLPFGAIGANLTVTPPALGNGILSAAVNNVLTATGAASQTLSGFLIGTEE